MAERAMNLTSRKTDELCGQGLQWPSISPLVRETFPYEQEEVA
jgi:hypothetical protein